MSETLAESQRRFIKGLDVRARAKRAYGQLEELQGELMREAGSARTPAAAELNAFYAAQVEEARELIRVLEMEQIRQRTTLKMFLQGMLERGEAREISESWNDDGRALSTPTTEKA